VEAVGGLGVSYWQHTGHIALHPKP